MNSFFSHKQNVHLDFSNVFAIQLEQAVESKLITNGRTFIEEIMRESRKCDSQDVVMKTSDIVFLRNARDTFVSWVMGLVKLKREDLGNAYKSCARYQPSLTCTDKWSGRDATGAAFNDSLGQRSSAQKCGGD